MKRKFLPAVLTAAALAALGAVAVFAASSDTLLRGGDELRIRCDGSKLTTTRVSTKEVVAKCVAAPTATPTRTPVTAPTATATPTQPPVGGTSPMIAGCPVFPANNAWNTDISNFPLDGTG